MIDMYGEIWLDDPMHFEATPWKRAFVIFPKISHIDQMPVQGRCYKRTCENRTPDKWVQYISRTQFAVLRLKGEA